jgi:hypothetical protein
MTAPGEPLPATYGEHLMSVDTFYQRQRNVSDQPNCG